MMSSLPRSLRLWMLGLVALMVVVAPRPATAGAQAEALATVAIAVAVVEQVRQDPNFQKDMEGYLARARAVLVVPRFYRGGFIVGASYGNGALLVRNDSGEFSPPAFFRLVGGSLGLQIGGQEAGMLFLIMTENGLNAILRNKFKFGAQAGLSVATLGANIEASTTSAAGADVIAFAHSRGMFGGGAVEGTMIEGRQPWNEAVYGAGADARGILFDRRYAMPKNGESLARALTVNTGAPETAPAAAPAGVSMNHRADPAPLDSPPGFEPPAAGTAPPPPPQPTVSGSDGLPPAPSVSGPGRGPLLLGPVDSTPLPPPAAN